MLVADCQELKSAGTPMLQMPGATTDERTEASAALPAKLPAHMESMAAEYGDRLTPQENLVVNGLLSEYQDRFNASKRDLQCTSKLHHSMTMKSSQPVKLPLYRVPLARLLALREELDDMLEAGIIETSCSAWASPLVLATKKSGCA